MNHLCKRGHEMCSENVYVKPNGMRTCRICQRASHAKARIKHREARNEYRRRYREENRERLREERNAKRRAKRAAKKAGIPLPEKKPREGNPGRPSQANRTGISWSKWHEQREAERTARGTPSKVEIPDPVLTISDPWEDLPLGSVPSVYSPCRPASGR